MIGFSGLLDFTGLSVGQGEVPPAPPPVSGFFGFFDFTGIPVAQGTGKVIIPKGHGGFRGAGRPGNRYANIIVQHIQEQRWKESKKERKVAVRQQRELLAEKLQHKWEREQRLKQKRLTEVAIYSVLLAEI